MAKQGKEKKKLLGWRNREQGAGYLAGCTWKERIPSLRDLSILCVQELEGSVHKALLLFKLNASF
jgi:hypothetical protein